MSIILGVLSYVLFMLGIFWGRQSALDVFVKGNLFFLSGYIAMVLVFVEIEEIINNVPH